MILLPITIINILGAILLTSVTGSFVTLLCVLAGKVLEQMGFVHIRFELLKLSAFFFLCPVSYLWVKLYEVEIGYGVLFHPTPLITDMCKGMGAIWGLSMFMMLTYMCFDIYRLRKRYRDAFVCPLWMQEIFNRQMEQLGIRQGKLRLCQTYRAKIPCVVGIRNPRILLPVEEYDPESLEIILTHEMTHYKQHDVLLKLITFCIIALHFFNPCAWVLFFQVQKQSEYVCDYRACKSIGDMKKYFSVLVRMASQGNVFSVLSSQLFERKHDLVERVEKMKKITKMKKRSKLSVALVLAVAMLTSNVSVYAATMDGVERYLAWYDESQNVESDESMESVEYVETANYETDADVTVVVAEIEQISRTVGNVNWSINNRVKMCTGYFSAEEDERVNVMLRVLPEDANVTVGIESMDGQAFVITGSGDIYHSFTVPFNSMWRIFVQNKSGVAVTVEGSYIIP